MMDLEAIKRRDKEDRIFKLLASLGKEFETLRSSVLMMQPLPSLILSFNNACSIIQREEIKRKVMKEEHDQKEDS